ncbi:MAG TPA: TonB-dependent receptor, partial [Burkholderiaceae bacterium]
MFRRTRVALAAATAVGGLAATVTGAWAQDTQRVEVTGSSIKRIEGESNAPIQVIKRADIEKTGITNVEQLLRTVSAMVSSNTTAAASAAGLTTGGGSTVSLRGLTPERTLVLINGKRVAPYGSPASGVAVDVNSIPLAAIERVEILKDGASAIYGSDAIAGVVNFILRSDYKGFEMEASYGAATQDGKGDITTLSAIGGVGDLATDKYNVMLIGTYQKDGALFGRDRDFANTSIRLDKNQNSSSSRTDPGNIGIPGVGVRNPLVNGATQTANCAPNATYVPAINRNICLFDVAPFVGLLPKTERFGLQGSGRVALDNNVELYGELGWSQNKIETVIQPSPIDAAFGIPFNMTTANPFYPTAFVQGQTGGATPTLAVRYRPFIIGNRDLTDTIDATRAVAGVRGTAAGWDYDGNLLYSGSQTKEVLNGGFFRINDDPATGLPGIVPLLSGAVLGTNGQPLWVNPFGANSAEVSAAAKATNFLGQAFKTNTSLTEIQGKASKEMATLEGGGLSTAFGAELRHETYKLDSAAALGTGNISGYGGNFVPFDTSRNVAGIFGEVVAPVKKGLELGAALRYDNYAATTNPLGPQPAIDSLSTLASAPSLDPMAPADIARIAAQSTGSAPSFGQATGKLGARWQAMPELLLRGTYSTGFRAPSLFDLYSPLQLSVSPVVNDPKKCDNANPDPNFCATQFNTYLGGNSQLKPEKSQSLTLGFVAEPIRGFSVGVDYFKTEVKDMIQTLSLTYILQNEAVYQNRVQRGPSGEIIAIDQRPENVGKVNLAGWDFDLRWNFAAGDYGRVLLGWTATYMSQWDSTNPDGSTTNNIGTTSGAV